MRCNTQALIFDVDGTLYDQGMLRRKMFFELLFHLVKKRRFVRDINVLYTFRKQREILSQNNNGIGCLENRQYAGVAHELGIGIEEVQHIVNDWIFEKPLNYLAACIYPGVKDLFSLLITNKIKIGIFSDYPCHAKLEALGLYADAMVCATEKEVDRFKPDPKGLFFTAEKLGVPAMNCFFIGDRDDKDGECARRAGMPHLILSRRRVSPSDWYQKATMYINKREGELFH
jgi:phosphoglycolate phosphatase/putative hydrolase of the HAD superfamily